MPATMARQGGRVQLEQFDMRLVLNMAKMAKERFVHAARWETTSLIKKPRGKIGQENNRNVDGLPHEMVKAGIHRHPVMLRQNQK